MPYLKLDRRTSLKLALARRRLAAGKRVTVVAPTPTGTKRLKATIVHGHDVGGSAVAAAAVGRTVIVRRTPEAIVNELRRPTEMVQGAGTTLQRTAGSPHAISDT